MIYAIDENKVHRKVDIAEAECLRDMGHKIVSADAEGWVAHNGRDMPTNAEQVIQWKDGSGFVSGNIRAGRVLWGVGACPVVTAYRPVFDQTTTRPTAGEQVKERNGEPSAASDAQYPACAGTNCGVTDGFSHSTECIREYEEAIGGFKSEEWNGEGLPPVGTVCEFKAAPSTEWVIGTVVAHRDRNHRNAVAVMDSSHNFHWVRNVRPVPTPREQWVDDCVYLFIDYYGNPKGAESYLGIATRLYDALASGELPLPEVRK